jgi:hypothetical protein
MRRPGVVAHGSLRLDGTLQGTTGALVGDLPRDPFVGRFRHPTDHVPLPDEDAVLSIVEVDSLAGAWDVLLRLLDIESRLGAKEEMCAKTPRPCTPRARSRTS